MARRRGRKDLSRNMTVIAAHEMPSDQSTTGHRGSAVFHTVCSTFTSHGAGSESQDVRSRHVLPPKNRHR
jgi:hypothetical protein